MTKNIQQLDLLPEHRKIVYKILNKLVPDKTVLAFGSRTTWTARKYSDLDLAVLGNVPLSLETIASLVEAFSESDLPWKVDIVDMERVDKEFRSIILQDGIVLQEPIQKSISTKKSLHTV